MKELTIEQKAKAYDEALKKLRTMRDAWNNLETDYSPKDVVRDIEYYFPELADRENERIRTFLHHTFTAQYLCKDKLGKWHGEPVANILAWLEKRGEQKPAVIIPKFRVGDEIKTSNEESLTITKIDEKGYWSEDLFICGFDDADKWELVEQKPAWSEEDEDNLTDIFVAIDNFHSINHKKELITFLKSLRPQSQWKPSDEQLDSLYDVLNPCDGFNREVLESLYQDLKKLKEE